jgi:antitoxin VapB
MMVTAKVFQSGRSQAVRVPMRYRFRTREVNILATPDGLLLTEKGPWELFREGVNELSDDFMRERVQPPIEKRNFHA